MAEQITACFSVVLVCFRITCVTSCTELVLQIMFNCLHAKYVEAAAISEYLKLVDTDQLANATDEIWAALANRFERI